MDGYHTQNKSNLAHNGNSTISNLSALSDKNVSHRFPYASTPSGSPLLNSTEVDVNHHSALQIQLQKANMKLPVGSLADSEQFPKKSRIRLKDMTYRRNVTVRSRPLLKNDACESTISPIEAGSTSRSVIQFTDPRGARQLFTDQKNIQHPKPGVLAPYSTEKEFGCLPTDSGNSTGSVSKSVFPYPNVTIMDNVDSGETLCNSLQILATLRALELEKQRLTGVKRKDKPVEEKVEVFEFTKDTFNFVNSDAAIQALYLLFRDCWPVYEKKMEGIFRRIVSDWMKEIIELNPTFFAGIRTEAIGGLLVNPGGERFIAMMRQFCQFVMYTAAVANKDIIKQQVLLPPEPSPDPEITNRQLQLLTCRSKAIQAKTVQKYKYILRTELNVALRIKRLDDANEDLTQKEEMLSDELRSCIYSYPDIFGTPSDAELTERDEIIKEMKINEVIRGEPYDDFIREGLETLLKKQADEIYKPLTLLHNIMEDYDKIWYILEMEKPKPAVLDWNEILPPNVINECDTPSMEMFLGSVVATMDKVLTDPALNEPVTSDLMNDLKAYNLRLSYLEVLDSQIKEEFFQVPTFTPIINFRNVVRMQLEGFDFSLLSKVRDENIRSLLDMTPLRVFDINKRSGRTPAINNFLDSSSINSSGLGERTTIVKRRSVNNVLPRPPRRVSCNVNNDTPDSAPSPPENRSTSDVLQTKNHKSDPLVLTPVSSQPNSSRNISLQRVSTNSFLKKSVSFDTTPPPSLDIPPEQPDFNASAKSSISSSVNTSLTSTTVQQSNVSVSEASEVTNSSIADMSTISDIDVLIELDVPTQERVSKLLESIAHNRSSLSTDPAISNDANNENSINRCKRDSAGISLNELSTKESDSMFGNISVVEDWEDTKGIMDMSHIEMNSDSDD